MKQIDIEYEKLDSIFVHDDEVNQSDIEMHKTTLLAYCMMMSDTDPYDLCTIYMNLNLKLTSYINILERKWKYDVFKNRNYDSIVVNDYDENFAEYCNIDELISYYTNEIFRYAICKTGSLLDEDEKYIKKEELISEILDNIMCDVSAFWTNKIIDFYE